MLKMENIFSSNSTTILMDHSLLLCQHTSRTDAQRAHHKNYTCEGEIFPHAAQHTPLFSQSCSCPQGSICIMPLLWQPVGMDISKGIQIQPLWPTCSIQNYGSFPNFVWHFRVQIFFQKLHSRNSQNKPSVGRIYLMKKPTFHIVWILKTREE